jgi:hypothetical protein
MVTSIKPRKRMYVWDIWEIKFIKRERMLIKKREDIREGGSMKRD